MEDVLAAVYTRGKASPVTVARVHVDGLARTSNALAAAIVRDIFGAKTLGDAILRAQHARAKLAQLRIFKDVDVRIDTLQAGADAPIDDDRIEVVFTVVERRLLTGNAGVKVSNNEGSAETEVWLWRCVG